MAQGIIDAKCGHILYLFDRQLITDQIDQIFYATVNGGSQHRGPKNVEIAFYVDFLRQ